VIPVVARDLSGGTLLVPRDFLRPDGGVDIATPGGLVEAEQTRLLLKNPIDVPANLINAGLVALVVWPLYQTWVVALWLGLACIVSLSRALLRHCYMHATGDARASPDWARVFTLNALVAGCLWGLAASVILVTPNPIYYNFIVFVLGGTMAGGVVCLAANMRAMLAFILPPRRRRSKSGSRCYAAGAFARLESLASGTGALACRRMFAIRSSISLSN
jgi:hypothetical protein